MNKKEFPVLGPHKDQVTWNETKRYYGVLGTAAGWIKQQDEAPMLRECFKALVGSNLVHDTEADYKSLLTRARGLVGFPAVAHDPADDRKNTDWKPIIATAKSWVEAQPYPVTLRQCFYHLVATHEIKENTEYRYTNLSRLTSDARWMDEFPDFSDESHSIYELEAWSDIEDYAEDAALGLTLDRTMGQEYQVVVGVEKRGMRAQASRLFSKRGWKIVPLGGYGSTTIKKRLVAAMEEDGRPSLLLYAGDFDASGEDIQRDFEDRVPFDLPTVKVALSLDQVREYGLPESFGKESDTRSEQFAHKYGTNLQVEVDALDPAELDRLMIEAAAPYWDESRWDTVMAEEEEAQQQIREALERL